MMATKNLYQRIAGVMASAHVVVKDAEIQAGRDSYKAVSHDAVLKALRPAMLENGIVATISQVDQAAVFEGQTKYGSSKIRFQALYEIQYVNIDDPEDKLVIKMEAHAEDMGDKAPGKAASYALKTAHLKTFSLQTGENDEAREATGKEMRQAAPVQVKDMRETYSEAAKHLGMKPAEIEKIAEQTIASHSEGGEIPPTVIALSEPLAIMVRGKLRQLFKEKTAADNLAAEKPADDNGALSSMQEKNDTRRKAINARIGELQLDRESVKQGLKALFGIDSTGQCGALGDDEWRRVMDDLPGIAEAGK